MSGRYVVRVGPDDVGRRVSLRSRRPGPLAAGEPTLTDTVGVLRSWQKGLVEVELRDGSRRQLRETDLVAGRILPERSPRSR